MQNFSKKSSPIFSVKVPSVKSISGNFSYNFYVADESINESFTIPEVYKTKTIEKNDINLSTYNLRVPRYITIEWEKPKFNITSIKQDHPAIADNLDKIITEDNFSSSKFMSYIFSNFESINAAYYDINGNEIVANQNAGISQATITDNFIFDILSKYSESEDDSEEQKENKQKNLLTLIKSIEKISDQPESLLGYYFSSEKNKSIANLNGFSQLKLISKDANIYSQLNLLVIPDIFYLLSIPKKLIDEFNSYHSSAKSNSNYFNFFNTSIQPIKVGQQSNISNLDSSFSTEMIGYLIERYEINESTYDVVKSKTIVIENFDQTSFKDLNVKYNSTYYYVIRAIAKVGTKVWIDSTNNFHDCFVYLASKPSFSENIVCDETVPPPPPEEIKFVWDYKTYKLNVSWEMPFNPQRDITQFQVFRRSSIYEPFELINQHCFDFSAIKIKSNEIIDGNKQDMSKANKKFVEYQKFPTLSFLDDDFMIDVDMLNSSRYIYTIASIDAHGYVSNYGPQFEVSFDFFENRLKKKLISRAGAPRQYPNLYLQKDLFKDTIKVSGKNSKKLKLYFMPEYFKLHYNNESEIKTFFTDKDNAYYKVQFVNLENQKSDSLKIVINDPNNLL